MLGARPVLAERVDATTYEGYVEDVEDSELGSALRWEHEVGGAGCRYHRTRVELVSAYGFTA